MNQLKHILGITLPNGLALRGSTLSRSAGTNGRDTKRSKIIPVTTNDRDDSTEPKLSSRSYARLIADYSRSVETRNATGKVNGESKICRPKGFFFKTPFQRIGRVSSLTNLKNVGINGGTGLCTKSSSRPAPESIKTDEKMRKIKSNVDANEVLNGVSARAEWLDHVVNAHNAKRLAKNSNFARNDSQSKNEAHRLVQRLPESRATNNASTKNADHANILSVKNDRTAHQNDVPKFQGNDRTMKKCISDTSVHYSSSIKTLPDDSTSDGNVVSNKSSRTGNSSSFGDSCERYCARVKKKSNNATSDGNNVSVVVQRLRKTDRGHKNLAQRDSGDGNAMLVTVTEQSKSYSTAKSSPLRHIDLRINGKPADGVDTIVNKVNKLDVVSSAEKIEITIPVASKSSGLVDHESRAPNSTINLCIPDHENESKILPIDVGSVNETKRIGDSTLRSSDYGFAGSKPFVNGRNENSKKTESGVCRSRVVPWWTTTESFRRCEIVSMRSTEVTEIVGTVGTKTSDVGGNARASGNQEAVSVGRTKEVDVSDAVRTTRFVPTKPSSSGQRSEGRTRGSVVTTIVASDSRKMTEGDERERQLRDQRVNEEKSTSVAKPEARTGTKVGITALNETSKKDTTTASVGSTMSGKSARASTPTLDGVSKKMTSSSGSTVAKPEGKSKTPKTGEALGGTDDNNSSKGKHFLEKNRVKPIFQIVDGMTDPGKKNGTTAVEGKSKTIEIGKELGRNGNNNLPEANNFLEKIGVKPVSQIVNGMADAGRKKGTIAMEGKSKTVETSKESGKSGNNNLSEANPFQGKFRVKPISQIADRMTDAGEKNTTTSTEEKSKTPEASKELHKGKNKNVFEGNNLQQKIPVKPISQIASGTVNAIKKNDTTTTEKLSKAGTTDSKVASKLKTDPRQEVASKTEPKATPELPRTYGKIKLSPSASSPAKRVSHENKNRCVIVRPNDRTANTIVKPLKNSTIAMKTVDNKNDGTPVDHEPTVNTSKKPERKLSGSESAAPSQTKKITREKEPAAMATVKEVVPRRNRDSRGNFVHLRSTEDTSKSRLNGSDNNRCRKCESHLSPRGPKKISKDATNDPNESTNSRTSVKSEKKILKDSNESQMVENASPDKKLLYSVWLRRFKERTGQDPDPTKDPPSRNS